MSPDNASQFTVRQQEIKEKIDSWLTELVEEHDTSQARINTLQREKQNWNQDLLKIRDDYIKKLDEFMRHDEVLLSQQIKESMARFDQEKRIREGKVQISKSEDIALKQERQRIEKIQRHLQVLEKKLAQQQGPHQKLLQEIASIEAECNAKSAEKQKMLETIKNLAEEETPQQEAKLKEITGAIERAQVELSQRQEFLARTKQEIAESDKKAKELARQIQILEGKASQQESQYQEILNQTVSLEPQLQDKNTEKQGVINTIKLLEEVELPQREAKLKEIEQKISRQESARQQLFDEMNSADDQIEEKTVEKQKVLDEIKRFEEVKIPQREAKLKKIDGEVVWVKSELHQRQDLLTRTEQEISLGDKRVEELSGQIQTLEERVSQESAKQQGLLKKSTSIETQIKAKIAEKERVSDTISHLEKSELPQREARLKEIKELIAKHETQHQRLLEEIAPVETQIQIKTTEKQQLEETIKDLEGLALPRQEIKLKELTAKAERVQAKIHERQGFLVSLEQEILHEKARIKELQDKETVLKKKYLDAELKQTKASESLNRLETEVNLLSVHRDNLSRKITRLQSEISAHQEVLGSIEESSRALKDKTAQKETLYQNLIKETISMTAQIQTRSAQKQALLDEIRHLEKEELPRQLTKLKETDKIALKQDVLHRGLVKEITALDAQVQGKKNEKRVLVDKIAQIEKTKLVRYGTQTRDITAETGQFQAEIEQRKERLAKIEQEITAQNNKINELQKENMLFEKGRQETETSQKKLINTLNQLENEISRKKVQRDELAKKTAEWRLKMTTRSESAGAEKSNALSLLTDKISQRQTLLEEVTQDYLQEQKEFNKIKKDLSGNRTKRILLVLFVVTLALFIMGSLGLFLWQAFFKG